MRTGQAVLDVNTTDLLGSALAGVIDAVSKVQERVAELNGQGLTVYGDSKALRLLGNVSAAVDTAKVIVAA